MTTTPFAAGSGPEGAHPVTTSFDVPGCQSAVSRPPEAGVPDGPLRLLAPPGGSDAQVGLDAHLVRWGSLPSWKGSSFLDELERSGLRGHGGAWFPVAAKWRSVGRSRLKSPVVVANGAEGEPASAKDRYLLTHTPHLVLDGAVLAAATVGATEVFVHVPRFARSSVQAAIEERRHRRLDRCSIDVVVAADSYLAGQESALVNAVNGQSPARPGFVALRPVRERGVRGRPTLVQNVESLAHASLIARFGASWFRSVGTESSPGTTLLTVTGRWAEPRIVEASLGTPLSELLGLEVGAATSVQGVLLGGYGGGWMDVADALSMPLTEEEARQRGSSIGAGVVVLLPAGLCPLLEVARVVRYMEGEGAGQCGPCTNGLATLAHSMELLALHPRSMRHGVSAIPTLCRLVDGRGACAHPDGVARFVRSAVAVFDDHVERHLRQGPCHTSPPFLVVPPRAGVR